MAPWKKNIYKHQVSCRSIGSSQKFDNMGNFVQIVETERLRFACYCEHTHVKFSNR
ncbi:hypothetical protein HanRHA438_Chr03g0136301 [Helianthus annuus]|nr:hypothetical protein HanIR_Chr03g0135581 [Helianthus annuus]KAJ0936911.1 hypothetical protein HanRHA438_Chr03g0136301 [Helianthus annuus]